MEFTVIRSFSEAGTSVIMGWVFVFIPRLKWQSKVIVSPKSKEFIIVSLILVEMSAGLEIENNESALSNPFWPITVPMYLPGMSSIGGWMPPHILLKLHWSAASLYDAH